MKSYVLCFLFNDTFEQVALIRKEHPAWQKGRYNGIGGKIKAGENESECAAREFREEAGVDIKPADWFHYCLLNGPDWQVHCYVHANSTALSRVKTITDEKVRIIDAGQFLDIPVIENLNWLIPMARDYCQSRFHTTVNYR